VSIAATFVVLGALGAPSARAQPSLDEIQCANQDRAVPPDRVIASCAALIERGPQTSRNLSILYYNRGLGYRRKGDSDRALADFNEAIKADPNNTFALMTRGSARYEQGDNNGAIADYDEAIRVDPKNALAFTNRCNAYRTGGDHDRAIADCDEAIRLNPRLAAAFDNRAIAHLAKGDADRAIGDLDEAIRLDPIFALAFLNRGFAHGAKRDYDRALADYDEAIRLAPNLAQAFNNRGSIFRAKGDDDRAIADFDAAIRLDTGSAEMFYNRGSAYLAKGAPESAVADFDRAVALDPKFAAALGSRGLAHDAMGDAGHAVADYDAALRLSPGDDPKNQPLYRLRGYLSFRMANYAAATSDLVHVVRQQPADAYPVLWLYLARARTGERDATSRMRANARGLKAADWPFPVTELLLGRRTPQQTLSSAKTPAERCEAHFYIGEWHLLRRDGAAARRAWETAIDTCPKSLAEYAGAVAELKRLGPVVGATPASAPAKPSASRSPR
jgi:tetratricopeptide (TPR) repeat protein